jgi:hypothetical protein
MTGIIAFWKKYTYEIIVVSCVAFLVLGGIVNGVMKLAGKRIGSWDSTYSYDRKQRNKTRYYSKYPLKKRWNVSKRRKELPPRIKNESRGETQCKRVVESIFGVPFEKTRPDFLNNHVTKNNLELDCYNADLKIAVEFDGRQHYEFVPFFHRNEDAFRAQQYRDYMKQKKCEENGILLIRVPYTTTLEQIEPYIRSSLRAAGYNY